MTKIEHGMKHSLNHEQNCHKAQLHFYPQAEGNNIQCIHFKWAVEDKKQTKQQKTCVLWLYQSPCLIQPADYLSLAFVGFVYKLAWDCFCFQSKTSKISSILFGLIFEYLFFFNLTVDKTQFFNIIYPTNSRNYFKNQVKLT